jgi:uncharacterized protein YndB with AHSA1/START domain
MNLVVHRSVEINATPAEVWKAMTDPNITKLWIMGLEVSSDWKVNSSVMWEGVSNGKEIIHKGYVLKIEPKRFLQISDFGLETGLEDIEANYTRITYELSMKSNRTVLTVTEDKFNGDENRYKDAESFWDRVLLGIKVIVEQYSKHNSRQ